jgi:ATP-dependent helicase Lhr and Lhr-like helicase
VTAAHTLEQAQVRRWFAGRGWQPLPFQCEVWSACAEGDSGLLHAPTGSGKTLAVWFGALLDCLAPCHAGCGAAGSTPRVLWITPLRALAVDTTATLARVVADLELDWRVEQRTGDTSQAIRSRQRKRLPEALVTTPESLSLLLSYADAAARVSGLRYVIVDEWHELLGTKRGVQLELCLSWLRARCPELRIWGLSATLGNLEQALAVLLGDDSFTSGRRRLVTGLVRRDVDIDALIPAAMERFPSAGQLGLRMLPAVIEALESAASTLLFTNTRAQAERWFHALISARPDWLGSVALHHGSLDRDIRHTVESWLREGCLRCVVATSSLDLGVDFSPVEQVIQIGSPRGVARLLQRAGRSGHAPGRRSRLLCVPTHALELVEIAAARRAWQAGRIESREPVRDALDVLAQHLVTLALGPGFRAEETRREVLSSHAYARLSQQDWDWVLEFICTGGPTLAAYPNFRKVVCVEGVHRVVDARIGRLHRLSIGTITADGMLRVRLLRGAALGLVEESFISRVNPGERFLFAGRLLELVRIRDMIAYVRPGSGSSQAIPRWLGGRMPLSGELADGLLELLSEAAAGRFDGPEMQAVAACLRVQAAASRIPRTGMLLIEWVRLRDGEHLFVYPFAGRLVHEGLAALLAWRLTRQHAVSCAIAVNDYGFVLIARRLPVLDEAALRALVSADQLEPDLLACLNGSEMARRHFREIARIAGLVFQGYPGASKSARQIQASSGLIHDVFQRYDPDHRLLWQTRQELLERQLDYRRLRQTLADLQDRDWHVSRPPRLTPLGFPLWVSRVQARFSSEDWQTRVAAMLAELEREASA